ncbi:MAG: ecotin family protein [Vulcanococcus sp.]
MPVGPLPRLLPLLTALAVLPSSLPALAIPRLDLSGYPPAPAGTVRWVIQLPGVLRPSPDPSLSADPADWRVELLVGREQTLDCNLQRLQGEIQAQSVPGWGTTLYRVSGGSTTASTRMACPPGAPRRQGFVSLAGPPTVVPYSVSLPIVVDAPRGLQVRWRLWKAESRQQLASPQP